VLQANGNTLCVQAAEAQSQEIFYLAAAFPFVRSAHGSIVLGINISINRLLIGCQTDIYYLVDSNSAPEKPVSCLIVPDTQLTS
jgi:hypothetical protein